MKIILQGGQPYIGNSSDSASKMAKFVEDGIWLRADLERYGFQAAEAFVVPAGKIKVGNPSYTQVDGPFWQETYSVSDPPPPTADQLRRASYDTEPDMIDILNRLNTATPAQINSWIDTNVTNIATARTVLKAIVKLLIRVS